MNYEEELQNIKDWLKELIIIQYRQSKRNRALIDLMTELLFAKLLILQIRDLCLNVEKSIGAQLDVVGRWVGLDRYYNGIDLWDHPYTSFVYYSTVQDSSYDQYQGGFSTFLNFENNDGGFLTYKTWQDIRTRINQIGDSYFRELIKLKIVYNSINHTKKSIDDAIWKWSNGKVYTTWNIMEVTYHFDATYENIMKLAVYKNILPRPTGCNVKTEIIT